MRVDLDAKVRTSDGHDAGTVQRAVWDPSRNEVSEFVVSTGGLFGHDVIVGRDVLERATRDGDVLVVGMTKDELERAKPYDEAGYTPPPTGWMAPVAYGYGMPGYVWPVTPMVPTAGSEQPPDGRRMPRIDKGMPVKDATGDVIGDVQDLVLDEKSGELRALVVRRGNALERLTSGGDTIRVEVDQIDIGDGAVHVVAHDRAPRQPL